MRIVQTGAQNLTTKKSLKDPFNHDLIYELEGSEYTLKSLGKDGREGGSGNDKDITLEDLDSK